VALALVQYLITPKEYRATSLIQIERRIAVPLRGLEDAWLENWWNVEYYPTQYRLLASRGLGPQDVLSELARREGVSGLDEKAGRNG